MKLNGSNPTVKAIAVAVALAFCIGAVPASADEVYAPQLDPNAVTAKTAAPIVAAAYTPAATPMVVTRVAKRRVPGATTAATTVSTTSGNTELAKAQAILDSLIAKHPILKGVTVSIGDARGYQAIAFYTSGRIVISATHTATLDRILNHEVWHIIDWRDNGRIDWGEAVPPRQ